MVVEAATLCIRAAKGSKKAYIGKRRFIKYFIALPRITTYFKIFFSNFKEKGHEQAQEDMAMRALIASVQSHVRM